MWMGVQISVFTPSEGVHYLNITVKNVLAVFGNHASATASEKKRAASAGIDVGRLGVCPVWRRRQGNSDHGAEF